MNMLAFYNFIVLIKINMAKRIFDFVFSIIALILLLPLIFILILIATIDTKSFGVFFQKRVGQNGLLFYIYKIKTYRNNIPTKFGNFLRRTKLDELPQLFNVLFGKMSFVGPRPDIVGYYDLLEGENKNILKLKPGITCLASLKYKNEEAILALQENPQFYNDKTIFPDKIRMNLDYYYNNSTFGDIKIIIKTIFR